MNESQRKLIELIRACVFKTGRVGGGISDVPKEVLKLAQKHDVAHLLGVNNNDYYQAIFRYDMQSSALTKVKSLLEAENIDYVPLKGAVIRELYPEPGMRTCCDIDLLIHEEDEDIIVQILGSVEGRTSHHIIVNFEDVNFELHSSLAGEGQKAEIEKLLDEAWSHEENHAFDSAFFYFYFIAHLARHFSYGGGGIRPFIDLQFIERDHALLKESGLEKFAVECEKLSNHWFKGTEEYNADLEDFVMNSSLYSDLEKWAQIGAASEGRAKHFFSRLFMPYDKLKNEYPVLKNNKWLLPACEAARILRVIKRGRVKEHIQETKEIVASNNSRMSQLMNELKL